MMIKKSIQLISPKVLVLISTALLILFLGYWNINNYRQQKANLKTNILAQLELAHSDVKDSLMMVFVQKLDFSNPIDSGHIHIKKNINQLFHSEENDISYNSTHISKEADSILLSLELNHVSSSDFDNIEIKRETFISLSDDLPNAKKIIIKNDSITKKLITDIDLGLRKISDLQLDKINIQLLSRLEKSNLPKNFTINTLNDSFKLGWNISYDNIEYQDKALVLNIQDHRLYLLKKILPELIFSFFLLSLVCIAFWNLLRSRRQQEYLNKLKNDFISNMTHELKTPIATINVALEEISQINDMDSIKSKEYLDISKLQIDRLSMMVDNVLQISTIRDEHKVLNKSLVNLTNIIYEVLESMKLLFEQKNIQFIYTKPEDTIMINADGIHITNLIYNLLDNAVKYSNNNAKINLSIVELTDQVEIKISDNGIGIPNEYLPSIFDRFFRVPTNNHHNIKGYGLGLSYVYEIIKAHNGDIDVKSTSGKGTTFSIKIPNK